MRPSTGCGRFKPFANRHMARVNFFMELGIGKARCNAGPIPRLALCLKLLYGFKCISGY